MYVVSGRVYYVTFDSNLGDVNALISVTNLSAGDCVQIIDIRNYFHEYLLFTIIYYFLIFIITFYIYTITFTILSRF